MSFHAMSWAIRQKPKAPAARHLLLILANYADEDDWCCYPSIATLVADTGLNRKTIISRLKDLEAEGLIRDTGERCGRTKQIPVYQLIEHPKQSQKGDSSELEQSQKGDSSEGKESLIFPETVPNLRGKSPKLGTRNLSENLSRNQSERERRKKPPLSRSLSPEQQDHILISPDQLDTQQARLVMYDRRMHEDIYRMVAIKVANHPSHRGLSLEAMQVKFCNWLAQEQFQLTTKQETDVEIREMDHYKNGTGVWALA